MIAKQIYLVDWDRAIAEALKKKVLTPVEAEAATNYMRGGLEGYYYNLFKVDEDSGCDDIEEKALKKLWKMCRKYVRHDDGDTIITFDCTVYS